MRTLVTPPPTWQSQEGTRKTGREAGLCPLTSQWGVGGSSQCRGGEHCTVTLSLPSRPATLPAQGGNSLLRLFCRVRPGEGQGKEQLPLLTPPLPHLQEKPPGTGTKMAH